MAPPAHSLLGQQVERSLSMQRELLSDPLIDLKTAALSLGGISYASLNRIIYSGRLRIFRVGKYGRRKVRLSSLRALLAEGESQVVQP
jgi:hypothetical protein